VVIWYIFPRFGLLSRKKSGSPDHRHIQVGKERKRSKLKNDFSFREKFFFNPNPTEKLTFIRKYWTNSTNRIRLPKPQYDKIYKPWIQRKKKCCPLCNSNCNSTLLLGKWVCWQRPIFNNTSLSPGLNFAPRGELSWRVNNPNFLEKQRCKHMVFTPIPRKTSSLGDIHTYKRTTSNHKLNFPAQIIQGTIL
jgi:hypothetical protein